MSQVCCDLDLCPIDLMVSTSRGPAVEYVCIEFVVDSSSRFFLLEHGDIHTKSQMPLIPTHQLLPV